MPNHEDDEHDPQTPALEAENDSSSPYVGEYDKLVRDDIPAVVREDGNEPVTRRVDGDERERYLAAKLLEEAQEYAAAVDAQRCGDASATGTADGAGDGDAAGEDNAVGDDNAAGDNDAAADAIDELADVRAVLDAIVVDLAANTDLSPADVLATVRARQREKAADRGAFADGVVLERIESGDDA